MSEILIVGAGPTGLTAAVELLRRGYRPRIIDKADGHPVESRALLVNTRTLQIFEPAGLSEQFVEQANLATTMHATDGETDTVFRVDLSAESPPYNFAAILCQADTERILANSLQRRGVKVEWNTELTDLRLQGSSSAARAVIRITGPGGEETLQPDFVIGADGAHSIVRKSLGIGFQGERQANPFGLVDVRFAEPIDASTVRLRFLPKGLLVFIPISSEFGRFASSVPGLLNDLPACYPKGERVWETEFNISFRHVDAFQKGNVFLAGDAAHIHSPVGGRGMNLGIEDAAWLAWLISENRPEDYTRDRLPIAQHVLRFTKQQTRQAIATGPVSRFLRRRIAPIAMGIPFVRARALRALRALDTRQPPWLK